MKRSHTPAPGEQREKAPLPRVVAIVANADEQLFRFRAPLVRALIDQGVRVHAIAPPGPYIQKIESLGANFVPWHLSRRGYNPFVELTAVLSLVGVYRRLQPQLVQHFTVKPNVYGALAARLAGVPVVVGGVTGLGYLFTPGSEGRRVMRMAVTSLYRTAAMLSQRITFQNQDDIDLLMRSGGLPPNKGLLIPGGSGVDLDAFSASAVDPDERARLRASLAIRDEARVVLLAARMLYDKGIEEFVDAARIVRQRTPEAHFLLAGAVDSGSRGAVPRQALDAWTQEGSVRYLGHREDMTALMAISDIVALPSYYREGIPRVLLEAAAMGRPIVATDMPGIREAVRHDVNGLLVPPRDKSALAEAIAKLLDDADLRTRLGQAGRPKAEREFDDRLVATRYLAEYARLWQANRR